MRSLFEKSARNSTVLSTPEEWQTHPIYSAYRVSDQGRIQGIRPAGHILKPGRDKDGYLRVVLMRGDGGKAYKKVHILVLETFVGPMPAGCWGLHENDNKNDNRRLNLRWGPYRDNYTDWLRNGGSRRGTHHGMSKLTDDQILAIRSSYAVGAKNMYQLADEYDVNRTTIGNIINRKTWTHV